MTAMELNAELFRELSIIADDEGLMKKAVKYLKKLVQLSTNGLTRQGLTYTQLRTYWHLLE